MRDRDTYLHMCSTTKNNDIINDMNLHAGEGGKGKEGGWRMEGEGGERGEGKMEGEGAISTHFGQCTL